MIRRLLEESECGDTKDETKLYAVLIPACVFFVLFVAVFSFNRNRYPKIYQPNSLGDEALVAKIEKFSALIWAVWSSDEVLEKAGCDAFLFLGTIKGCFKVCLYSFPFAIITLIVYATGGEKDYGQCGWLPLLSMSNVPSGIDDSQKLWAPFAQMVVVVSVGLYVMKNLFKELSIVADKNHSKSNAACYSVMIYNIQMEPSEFTNHMQTMYDDAIVRLEFVQNTSSIHKDYLTYIAAGEKFDLIEKDGEKAATCGCIGGTGSLEDADIAKKEAKEAFKAHEPNELEDCPLAIATFRTARQALECSQVALLPGGRDLMTRMTPFKDDIYFENLHHTEAEKTTFRYIGFAAYFCLILFFSPIMVAIQRLADLDSLADKSGFVKDLTELNPSVTALIQGLMPVIIFSIFFALLPLILWFIVGLSRPQCKNDQEGAVLPMYADCLIGMGLLVAVFSNLLNDLDAFTNINELAKVLANELPSQSVFYMGYILNAAFFGLALELSGVVALILSMILGGEQPQMIYYTAYPSVIMMFCLTLTYTVIAPITLVWGMLYFGLSYWIWKYQLLYVYKYKKDSYTWKFYPSVFSRLHAGIVIMQLILVGLFVTYSAVPQACLTLFTLVGTVASLNAAKSDYGYYFERPSLQATVDFDSKESKGDKKDWTEEQLFTPPSVLLLQSLKSASGDESKIEVQTTDDKKEEARVSQSFETADPNAEINASE